MGIKITTLSENTATAGGCIAEWGLSILVEMDNLRLLLDTGASFSAVHNAQLFGVDLTTIDKIVLSHGHYDHTGGLKEVLRRSGPIEIVAHPGVWEDKCFVGELNGQRIERYVGIPFRREQIEGLGGQFQFSREPVWITEDVVTSGEVPLITEYEEVDPDMYVREDGVFRPDTLSDDLSLAIKTELGLVILLGCAHRGMINIIRHFQQITDTELIYCVIGGTHLLRASEERLALTTADLRETGVQRLGVSHCTGFGASAWLSREFPREFFMNNAGSRFTLF